MSFPSPDHSAADERWGNQWQARAMRLRSIERSARTGDVSFGARRWAVTTLRREAAFLERRFLRTGEPLEEGYGNYYLALGLFVAGMTRSLSVATRHARDEDRAFPHSLIFLS
ncbi:MAG: hypothetical protein ABI779_24635 [Acidobacteriota bacterium]